MPSNEFQILQEPWWRFKQHHGKTLLKNQNCTQMEGQFYELQTMGFISPLWNFARNSNCFKDSWTSSPDLVDHGISRFITAVMQVMQILAETLGMNQTYVSIYIYINNAMWCWNGQNILGWCKNTRELIDVNLWNIEIIYINSFYYNFWIVLIQ